MSKNTHKGWHSTLPLFAHRNRKSNLISTPETRHVDLLQHLVSSSHFFIRNTVICRVNPFRGLFYLFPSASLFSIVLLHCTVKSFLSTCGFFISFPEQFPCFSLRKAVIFFVLSYCYTVILLNCIVVYVCSVHPFHGLFYFFPWAVSLFLSQEKPVIYSALSYRLLYCYSVKLYVCSVHPFHGLFHFFPSAVSLFFSQESCVVRGSRSLGKQQTKNHFWWWRWWRWWWGWEWAWWWCDCRHHHHEAVLEWNCSNQLLLPVANVRALLESHHFLGRFLIIIINTTNPIHHSNHICAIWRML